MDIEAETQRIHQFVSDGNFHAAINIALSAMNACRRNQDQDGIDRFLQIIQGIVTTLKDTYGSH